MRNTAIPLVFGEVLFDCFDDGSNVLGGAPFNVAWHLQAFGLSPLLISRVGDDPLGRQIRAAMDNWGMSTAGLQLDSAHPTGRVEVLLRDGEPVFDILPQCAYDYIQRDVIPPVTPSLVYHGTLALRNRDAAETLAYMKNHYAAPIFMDINLRPPWWDMSSLQQSLSGVRWLKINEKELNTLVDSGEDVEVRARRLLEDYRISLAIVTRGGEGAIAVATDGEVAGVRPEGGARVVDTVGAGDGFASVCILGLTSGWPLEQTLHRAQAFASMIVGQRGATAQDTDLYRSFLRQWGLDLPYQG